jgi:hypothetical protein
MKRMMLRLVMVTCLAFPLGGCAVWNSLFGGRPATAATPPPGEGPGGEAGPQREREREKKPALGEQTDPEPEPEPRPAPEPRPQPPATGPIPVARAVPGKPGYVFSPFNNRLIDVSGIPSGRLVADPQYPAREKKHFRVP